MLLVAVVLVFLVAVNALYVAAEFAIVSSRRARIEEAAESGSQLAEQLLPILKDPVRLDRYIAACQVGITLSSLIMGFYGQGKLTPVLLPFLAKLFDTSQAALAPLTSIVLLIALTAVQVILGELIPKSIALRYPEQMAIGSSLPMRWSLFVLKPFISLLNGSAIWLMHRFGLHSASEHAHVHSPEELEFLFRESARGGFIDAGEREMLENVLHIRSRNARQIMIPRIRMVTASAKASPKVLLEELVTSRHTRFPVIGENNDEILGMLNLRELFEFAQLYPEGQLQEVIKPLPLLPEMVSVSELWAEMRKQRSHMAVLFDEYGGISGLVTLEDIIEEVVGELQDEFDREVEAIRQTSDGRVRLRGDLLVTAVNSRFLLDLPTDTDTIGGLIMEKLEHTPEVGERAEIGGVRFQVMAVQGGAVSDLSMEMPQAALAEGEGEA